MYLSLSLSLSLSFYLSLPFLGQVMSPHHSDEMSQKSQVPRVDVLNATNTPTLVEPALKTVKI